MLCVPLGCPTALAAQKVLTDERGEALIRVSEMGEYTFRIVPR